ncbi:MAG: hypothetical protein K2O85_07250, partial [Helicobacter sp.]|nr:hypothetical protein [Helicobacter sp.]
PLAAPAPPAVAESAAPDSAGGAFARELFAELVQKIYARSFELGQCFETHITFVSFENNELCWRSSASGACKERLRLAYSFIRMCVEEVYGVGTKIVPQKVGAGAETAPKTADSMPATSPAPIPPADSAPSAPDISPAPALSAPMPTDSAPTESQPIAAPVDSAPRELAAPAPTDSMPTHEEATESAAQSATETAPASAADSASSAPAPKPSAPPTFEDLKEEFPILGKVNELLGIKHIDVSDVKQ